MKSYSQIKKDDYRVRNILHHFFTETKSKYLHNLHGEQPNYAIKHLLALDNIHRDVKLASLLYSDKFDGVLDIEKSELPKFLYDLFTEGDTILINRYDGWSLSECIEYAYDL